MFYFFCFILFQTGGHLPAPDSLVTPVPTAIESPTEKGQEPEAPIERNTGYDATVPRVLLPISTGVVSEATIAARVGENLQQVLAGAVVGMTLSATDEAAGGNSFFALRLPPSLGPGHQPLYVLDGVPLIDRQDSNRFADLVPADMASIEVLKGPSASAIYGARGAYGVILIETRRGETGKPKFSLRQSLGTTTVSKRLGVRRFTRESAIETYGEAVDSLWQAAFFDHEAAVYQDDATALETLFSVRGGSGRTRYYASGSSLGKSGIVAGTHYDRDSLRLNLDHQLTDRLALGLSLGFSKIAEPPALNQNLVSTLGETPSFVDLAPDANGNYPNNPFGLSNPHQIREHLAEEQHEAERSTASLKIAYQLLDAPKNRLDLTLVVGLDDAQVNGRFDAFTTPNGIAFRESEDFRKESAHVLLTHQYSMGKLILRSRVGLEYETRKYIQTTSREPPIMLETSLTDGPRRERGFFLEETLTGPWYHLSAGLRADRTSRNVTNLETNYNPWLNGALRLSQLDVWTPIKQWLPEFKLRTAWGRTKVESEDTFGPSYARQAKNKPDHHREWDLGLDAGFWSGRGALALTFFNRKVDDLDIPLYNPRDPFNSSLIDNARHTKVEGFEASLSLVPLKGEDWHWQARLDYYSLKARVTDLQGGPYSLGEVSTSLGAYRFEQGWSPTSIIGSNREPSGQLVKLGDATPDYQLTWHNEVQRRAWSLTWLLDLRSGGEAIDLTRLITDYGGTSPDLDEHPDRIQTWQEGDTSPWVLDSSYIRLREIRLAYTISPSRLHGSLGDWLSSMEIALSGRNLKTWSDFAGYDPEQGSLGIGSATYFAYPTAKSAYLSITLALPAGR